MKKLSLVIVVVASTFRTAKAQEIKVPIFVSGVEGYKSYRIPAIISLPYGDLLAFCEGRVHGSGDFGDINIVTKRGSDSGRSWSTLQTVVDADDEKAIADKIFVNALQHFTRMSTSRSEGCKVNVCSILQIIFVLLSVYEYGLRFHG